MLRGRGWRSKLKLRLAEWTSILPVVFLALLAVWSLAVLSLVEEHSAKRTQRELSVSLAAQRLSVAVAGYVRAVDPWMKQQRTSYLRTKRLPSRPEDAPELGAADAAPQELAVVDAEGRVLAGWTGRQGAGGFETWDDLRSLRSDAADRLVFRVQGEPGRDPQWLQIALRLQEAGDAPPGAIVLSTSLSELRVYGEKDSGNDAMTAELLQDDSHPGSTQGRPADRALSASSLGVCRQQAPHLGTTAGAQRIAASCRVGDYPLVVAASMPAVGWHDLSGSLAALTLALAITSTVYLLIFARRYRRADGLRQAIVQQLQQASQRDAEANRLKTKFLASVSHDLRTPLNSILGFSDLIRNGTDNTSTARFADLIHQNGKHLQDLVNTLLDLSQIEAGQIQLRWEKVDLRAILSAVTQVHMITAEAKGLSLSLTVPETPLTIEVDRMRVTQVLNNLVNNAIKFTHAGGVWISAVERQGAIHIRVVDTGVGMPRDKLAHVFDRISQLAAGPGPEHGAGLGLALSRELVELMGGSITLVSEPWVGTEVDVRLPTRRAQA